MGHSIRLFNRFDSDPVAVLMHRNKNNDMLISETDLQAKRHMKILEQKQKLTGYKLYVLEVDGKVTGYADCQVAGKDAVLHDLYVDPSLRGRGFGGKLMDSMLKFFTDSKCMNVQTEIQPADHYKKKLVVAADFSVESRKPGREIWAKDLSGMWP
ncbi:MAG: GNAT family N-acetyltransferase [Candidatus Aenigmarchaeota archaeon]|nr:GNAT family N-acetyltransferase [Candidatus Aenigmarchaeota archaeon]